MVQPCRPAVGLLVGATPEFLNVLYMEGRIAVSENVFMNLYSEEVQKWKGMLTSMRLKVGELQAQLARMVAEENWGTDLEAAELFFDRLVAADAMMQYLADETNKQKNALLDHSFASSSAFIDFVREQQVLRVHLYQSEAIFESLHTEFVNYCEQVGHL
jgi:hypothetical protein